MEPFLGIIAKPFELTTKIRAGWVYVCNTGRSYWFSSCCGWRRCCCGRSSTSRAEFPGKYHVRHTLVPFPVSAAIDDRVSVSVYIGSVSKDRITIATSSVICVTAADSFPTVFANMLLPQVQLILCPLNQFPNYNKKKQNIKMNNVTWKITWIVTEIFHWSTKLFFCFSFIRNAVDSIISWFLGK